MSLRDLDLRSTYKSGLSNSDPVEEFLVPCLSASVTYDRLSGYFSSRIFALAAEGMAEFIQGQGRMRLLMSDQVTRSDLQALQEHYSSGSSQVVSKFFDSLVDLQSLRSAIEREHLEAMCWLLKEGRLEVRIVAYAADEPLSGPIFHPKVGIFTDQDGNKVSFSGSVNETAAGWTGNIEEFKVFKSWQEATEEFVHSDEANFEFFWNGGASPNFSTLPLPEAIRDKLIASAPEDIPTLRKKTGEQSAPPWQFRDYQLSAIDSWFSHGQRGILAMATGTGKTKTARGCIDRVLARSKSLIVVSAPFQHIARQWLVELSTLDPLYVPSHNWQDQLKLTLQEKMVGWRENVVIVGVQNTLASPAFGAFISSAQSLFDELVFIGDEAHGLGATAYRGALNNAYTSRLGLSATPSRYFDEIGTDVLIRFFQPEIGDPVEFGTVFKFDTTAALSWRDPVTGARALCDYEYKPHVVSLDAEEQQRYDDLTAQISKFQGRELTLEEQGILETYLFQRAAVIKTAKSKLALLSQLIAADKESIRNCLIYCYDNQQLNQVAELLNRESITFRRFTGEEGTTPDARFGGNSERDFILKNFGLGHTRVLLAIKCLDEGVDVPSAARAYILASSGNPREFIQRRGRLLRPNSGKDYATIHDFLVLFDDATDSNAAKNEIKRLVNLSDDALNAVEVREAFAPYIGEEDI